MRLLGSVIECAAGALPDKSHANAVEAPGGFRVWDARRSDSFRSFFARFHSRRRA